MARVVRNDFCNSYKSKKAVLFRGALSSWDILQEWSPSYLVTLLATTTTGDTFQLEPTALDVFISADNRRFSTAGAMTEVVKMHAGKLVEYVFSYPDIKQPLSKARFYEDVRESELLKQLTSEPRRVYLRTQSLPDGLYRDIATPHNITHFTNLFFSPLSVDRTQSSRSSDKTTVNPCLQCSSVDTVSASFKTEQELSDEELKFADKIFRQSHMQLWLGTQGNTTPLHYDRNHGLLAQIIGSKRIKLFSHRDTSYLYPDRNIHHLSQLNLRDFDCKELRDEALKKFPKFEEATRYETVLRPGDVLYIPPFWWHEVVSLDNALSVTFPWDLEGNEEIPPIMLR